MCDHEAPMTEEADWTYLSAGVLASLVGILVLLAPVFFGGGESSKSSSNTHFADLETDFMRG